MVEVTPRFKLKVEVCHWDETVVFVLFDFDVAQLLGKSCKELLAETKVMHIFDIPTNRISNRFYIPLSLTNWLGKHYCSRLKRVLSMHLVMMTHSRSRKFVMILKKSPSSRTYGE